MGNVVCPKCNTGSQGAFIQANQTPVQAPKCLVCGGSLIISGDVADFIKQKFYKDNNGRIIYRKKVSPNPSFNWEFELALDENTWEERFFDHNIPHLSQDLPRDRTTVDLVRRLMKF